MLSMSVQGSLNQNVTMEVALRPPGELAASGTIEPYAPDYLTMCPKCYQECKATEQLWAGLLRIMLDEELIYLALRSMQTSRATQRMYRRPTGEASIEHFVERQFGVWDLVNKDAGLTCTLVYIHDPIVHEPCHRGKLV